MPETKHVLIVEDAEDIKELLGDLLINEGYEVSAASNGRQALDFLRSAENLPRVIMLDLTMPELDGYGFRAEQEKDPKLSHIPIILMTAAGETEARAAKMGAQATLKKPFANIDTILNTIEVFFEA